MTYRILHFVALEKMWIAGKFPVSAYSGGIQMEGRG